MLCLQSWSLQTLVIGIAGGEASGRRWALPNYIKARSAGTDEQTAASAERKRQDRIMVVDYLPCYFRLLYACGG